MANNSTIRQADVNRLWSRWLDIVAKLSQNTQRAKRLSEKKYGQLHSSLMDAIDAGLEDESCLEHRDVLREMQRTCKPWVSLDAFYQADKHIVTNLLRTGRKLLYQLTGRHALEPDTVKKIRRASLLGGLSLALIALWGFPLIMSDDAMLRTRAFWIRTQHLFQRVSPFDILPIVLIVVILGGFWMLRSTKRY